MKKVSMKARKEIIEAQISKYKKSTKKGKQEILNNICESTGLSRDRAARLLSGASRLKTFNSRNSTGFFLDYLWLSYEVTFIFKIKFLFKAYE